MHTARLTATLGLVALAALGLAACAPDEPAEPTASPSGEPTQSETAEPTEEPTEQAPAFTMPMACSEAYGADLFAELGDAYPLNDPNMTLLSTQTVGALEILDETDPLRCGWGAPSEVGIASTIAEIDDDQADRLLDALTEAGFDCDDATPMTCSKGETIDGDAGQTSATETHVFGAGGWVATNELNSGVEPAYSEDMRDALWG